MNSVVKSCLQNGFLIEPELVNILSAVPSFDNEISEYLINVFCSMSEGKILSIDSISKNIERMMIILNNHKEQRPEKKEIIEEYCDLLKGRFRKTPVKIEVKKAIKEEEKETEKDSLTINGKIKITNSYALPSKSINVSDFVNHFRNRFILFRNILQEHTGLQNLTSINKLSGQKQNISIIGMVFNKRITKNKNILLEVEDLTGRVAVLVNANKEEVFKKAQEIVLDDILGFKCSGNNEILFVNDIIMPDTFLKEKKTAPCEEYALFIADLHVGSNKFLEKQFLNFIDWVNMKVGNKKHQEMASKLKYIFVLGDLVDGIGIYPGQEDELVIKEVTQQYEKVAELLSKIRDDIKIIICPGNHDAVRIAEPQPVLDEKFAASIYSLKNTIFLSNPATLKIGCAKDFSGLNILLYHGYSFEYYASNVDAIRLNSPSKRPDIVMDFLLKRRHLAPTHSSTPYMPSEKEDPLAIHEIPDIFVSAHMHKSSVSYYNGVLNIACSCWQSTTPFQEKIGHEPDPCKVPILNLKTGQVNIIDFSS